MKKLNKKVVVSLIGAALMVASVGTASVFAAPITGSTDLGYDHGNVVPENPTNPEASTWAVSIPTNVEFAAKGDKREMDINLKGINDTTLDKITQTINVTVASANTKWALSDGGSSEIPYTLTYDSKTNAGIGTLTLTKAAPTLKGTVTLGDDTSASLAHHTDKLTYTIEAAVQTS